MISGFKQTVKWMVAVVPKLNRLAWSTNIFQPWPGLCASEEETTFNKNYIWLHWSLLAHWTSAGKQFSPGTLTAAQTVQETYSEEINPKTHGSLAAPSWRRRKQRHEIPLQSIERHNTHRPLPITSRTIVSRLSMDGTRPPVASHAITQRGCQRPSSIHPERGRSSCHAKPFVSQYVSMQTTNDLVFASHILDTWG